MKPKKDKYWAFTDREPTLLNILLEWLGDIGYTTIRYPHLETQIEILWNGCDTGARLYVDKKEQEVILYTQKTHPSIIAGIYDEKAFGRMKRFLELYAKTFSDDDCRDHII